MNRVDKIKALAFSPVDVSADIELINRHSIKELTPEEVFAFSVILCGNEIDRDYEQFANTCLEQLAPLFVGKTGIFNHSWNAKDQVARIYRTAYENGDGKNEVGEQKKQIKAFAYIPRIDSTADTIAKIESGILREVSVGVSIEKVTCSICGSGFGWAGCEEGHRKGQDYDGKLCYGIMDDPIDAYEFSFVAVPAQRDTGVTKAYQKDAEKAFEIVFALDLSKYPEEAEKLKALIAEANQTAEEKAKRQDILARNKKFITEVQE